MTDSRLSIELKGVSPLLASRLMDLVRASHDYSESCIRWEPAREGNGCLCFDCCLARR